MALALCQVSDLFARLGQDLSQILCTVGGKDPVEIFGVRVKNLIEATIQRELREPQRIGFSPRCHEIQIGSGDCGQVAQGARIDIGGRVRAVVMRVNPAATVGPHGWDADGWLAEIGVGSGHVFSPMPWPRLREVREVGAGHPEDEGVHIGFRNVGIQVESVLRSGELIRRRGGIQTDRRHGAANPVRVCSDVVHRSVHFSHGQNSNGPRGSRQLSRRNQAMESGEGFQHCLAPVGCRRSKRRQSVRSRSSMGRHSTD